MNQTYELWSKVFDFQFWVILVVFIVLMILAFWWAKSILVSAISESVSEVVKDQWAAMFKKMDEYTAKVSDLESKVHLNRKDIDEILLKVQSLK
jgi:flagellar basal body-associated protein FliL